MFMKLTFKVNLYLMKASDANMSCYVWTLYSKLDRSASLFPLGLQIKVYMSKKNSGFREDLVMFNANFKIHLYVNMSYMSFFLSLKNPIISK